MLGLRTAIYKVSDIDAAKEWYAKAFETPPYFDEPFYVGFNIGGFELGLQPEEPSTDVKLASVIAYWGVTEVEKEYQRLLDLGATPNNPPMNVGGPIVVASVKDPWGNNLGIIHNPVFEIAS